MKLAFRELGDSGTPLIILHGLLGASDNWLSIGRELAEDHRVYLLDLRNHGKSPHDPVHTYPAMADDVNEFMHDHELKKVSIMGHSMGGKVAMTYALQFPHKVDRLVIVDIAPGAYHTPEFAGIIEKLQALNLAAITSRKDAEAQLATDIPDAVLRSFLLKNLSRDRQHNFHWRVNLQAFMDNMSALISAIPQGSFGGPALFIRGENSDYIREKDHPEIKNRFAGATIETIADAGHWVHADQPETVSRLINNFFKRSY